MTEQEHDKLAEKMRAYQVYTNSISEIDDALAVGSVAHIVTYWLDGEKFECSAVNDAAMRIMLNDERNRLVALRDLL